MLILSVTLRADKRFWWLYPKFPRGKSCLRQTFSKGLLLQIGNSPVSLWHKGWLGLASQDGLEHILNRLRKARRRKPQRLAADGFKKCKFSGNFWALSFGSQASFLIPILGTINYLYPPLMGPLFMEPQELWKNKILPISKTEENLCMKAPLLPFGTTRWQFKLVRSRWATSKKEIPSSSQGLFLCRSNFGPAMCSILWAAYTRLSIWHKEVGLEPNTVLDHNFWTLIECL